MTRLDGSLFLFTLPFKLSIGIHIFTSSWIWPDIQNWQGFIYGEVVLFCFNYFIMMCWLFPGDGGWGQWSNWTDCTKSCGAGVRSRRRECDSPSPEGEGNYCEGLGTEVVACNTDHCPGTFTQCVQCRWGCEYECCSQYSWFYVSVLTGCHYVCVL